MVFVIVFMGNTRVVKARSFRHPGRIWVAMLLCYVSWVMLMGAVVLIVMLFVTGERMYGVWGLGALVSYILLLGMRYLQSEAIKCPLCHGPALQSKRCRKHADARRHLFFGHRVSIMIDLLIFRRFHCMYCGTPFRLRE